MTKKDLDNQFNEAFKKVSLIEITLSSEMLLKLYAYYKQGKNGDQVYCNIEEDTRNDFKTNAWMQLKGMKPTKAKQEYINLVNSILQ